MPLPTDAVSVTEPVDPAVPFAGNVPRVKVTICPTCVTPVRTAVPVAVTPGLALNVTVGILAQPEPLLVTYTAPTAPLVGLMNANAVGVTVQPAPNVMVGF